MIPAAVSPAFQRLFAAHCRARMRRSFAAVRVEGLDGLRQALVQGPVVVVSNHASWWDPLVLLLLTRDLGAEGLALMDAANLRRLPFFRLLGAFGVDRQDPRDGALALRYAARHLAAPGRLVWIFPQGEERHHDPRPLGFEAGAAALARLAHQARVVPVGLRYAFAGQELPELLVSVGEPLPVQPALGPACRAQEEAVEAELDRCRRWLAQPGLREQLPVLLHASPARVGGLAERVLAWGVGWLLRRRSGTGPGAGRRA